MFFPRVDRPSGDRLARLIGSSGVFTGLSLSSLKTPVFLPLCCFSLMAFPEILPPSLRVLRRRCWILYHDVAAARRWATTRFTRRFTETYPRKRALPDLNSLYTSFTSTLRARRQISRTISTCRFDAIVSYIGANWKIFKNYRLPHRLFLSSCPVLEDFQAGRVENYDASIISGSIILNYRGLVRRWSFV